MEKFEGFNKKDLPAEAKAKVKEKTPKEPDENAEISRFDLDIF